MRPDVIHTTLGIRADVTVSRLKIKKHCMTIRNYVFEDYISKDMAVCSGDMVS